MWRAFWKSVPQQHDKSVMYEILLVSLILVAVALIGFILVQHGKGADMGASFGAGASGTVFGSSGTGNFLTRTTAVLAVLFFSIAMSLAYIIAHRGKAGESGITSKLAQQAPISTSVIPKKVQPSNSDLPVIDTTVNVNTAAKTVGSAGDIPQVKTKKAQPTAVGKKAAEHKDAKNKKDSKGNGNG